MQRFKKNLLKIRKIIQNLKMAFRVMRQKREQRRNAKLNEIFDVNNV